VVTAGAEARDVMERRGPSPGPGRRSGVPPRVPASKTRVRTRASACLETRWRRAGDGS